MEPENAPREKSMRLLIVVIVLLAVSYALVFMLVEPLQPKPHREVGGAIPPDDRPFPGWRGRPTGGELHREGEAAQVANDPFLVGDAPGAATGRALFLGEASAPDQPGRASWRLDLPREGEFTLWLRLGGASPAEAPASLQLRLDNRPPWSVAPAGPGPGAWAWFAAGQDLVLTGGTHTLELTGAAPGLGLDRLVFREEAGPPDPPAGPASPETVPVP